MTHYDRSHDPLADRRRTIPSTGMSLLLAAVAAVTIVSGIYAITHAVGPDANYASAVVQQQGPNR